MPRPTKQQAAPAAPPVNAPNSMVASAARMHGRSPRNKVKQSAASGDWQAEGWRFYDTVGELAFAAQWVSNVLSQVRIVVVADDPVTGDPVRIDPDKTDLTDLDRLALAARDDLFNGDAGQEQMLSELGVHFTIPGESYLVGVAPRAGDPSTDHWRVLSNDEVHEKSAGVWEIDRGDGVVEKYDLTEKGAEDAEAEQAVIIRIWRSHPRKHVHATSPVRAALPVLRELEGLTKHVAASIDSRLSSAGILLVPSEATFDTPVPADTPAGEVPPLQDANALVNHLLEVASLALTDPGSSAARVPIVLKVPGSVIDSIKHIKFDSPLSTEAKTLREEAIRRLALALDMPPEVLLGLAGVNHWSGWAINEDAIKTHVEPLVSLVMHALTTRYLWLAMQEEVGADPALRPPPEVTRYRFDGDTSLLRQRPNRSAEAQELHARMVISDDALRRENGFTDADAPDDAEKRRRYLENIAGGVTTADLTAAGLAALGVNLVPKASEVETAEAVGAGPSEPRALPAPASPADPGPQGRTGPPADSRAASAVLAATEVVIDTAVTRAWNRAGRRGAERRPVPASRLAETNAFNGAWANLPRVASLCGLDPDSLTAACEEYATAALVTGADVMPEHVWRLLVERVLPASPAVSP